MENRGQKVQEWTKFWEGLTPESEIRMWDYYGLRHWVLKYTPRFGKVCEAGCGLGRYVFYLSRLGVEIEGLDFEEKTIQYLNHWKQANGFDDIKFIEGDVKELPYKDNSLSGYISLGVVEHFIEGPSKVIQEAHRALRPGGVAIITTPSISWHLFYRDYLKRGFKNTLKKALGKKVVRPDFFQYWYRPNILRNYVEQSDFKVVNYAGADLLYSFIEANNFNIEHWTDKSLPVKIANIFENSALSSLGAQSVTISIKVAGKMYCFLCGDFTADKKQLDKYDVPICSICEEQDISAFYKKGLKPKYNAPYKVFPPFKKQTEEICEISGQSFLRTTYLKTMVLR